MNYSRLLICIALWIFAVSDGVAKQACNIPVTIPQPGPTSVDYVNKNIPVDYYALALSWSPQYCATHGSDPKSRFQCMNNHFGFVVHGLWPQSASAQSSHDHPRNCNEPEQLEPGLIRTHLCTVPGAQLIQDEWNKHGSCAFPSADAYFSQIETLWKDIHQPDFSTLRKTSKGRVLAGDIRRAFVKANSSQNSGLKPENVMIAVESRNRFSGVMICYDKQFSLMACPAVGTPDNIALRLAQSH